MTCCKAEEFGWCEDLKADCQDEDGNKYCVFHAPIDCKGEVGKDEFESLVFQGVDEAIKDGGLCEFSGTIFQWEIHFNKYDIYRPFPPIDFSHATFSDEVSFRYVTFSDEANFLKATFNNNASFRSATFGDEACFLNATFSDGADFIMTTFSGEASFLEAIFSHWAQFHDTTFSGEAEFRSATFSGGAVFRSATFSNNASFRSATFSDVADFTMTTFSDKAYFTEATFSDGADFTMTIFRDEAYFPKTTFRDEASFIRTTFSGEAYFKKATFSDRTDFREATFEEEATFIEAIFQGIVQLEDTKYCDSAYFDRTVFSNIVFLRRTIFFNTAYFKDNVVEKYLVFDSVDMKLVSLVGTDVSTIRFRGNCKWPSTIGFFDSNRPAVHDDLVLTNKSKPEEYRSVGLVYRQLKQRQKESHNEEWASYWHFGEKEMFRKERWWRSWPISITFWYWLSSGYGERPVRAGVFLAVPLFLLALILSIVQMKHGATSSVGFLTPTEWINFKHLVQTIVQYALFIKSPDWMPVDPLVNGLLLAITRLLVPIQGALFGFALRNRFRR